MLKKNVRIFLQLAKEFWLPFLLALAWTAYNANKGSGGDWDGATVNAAFVTFFGIAWWFGQWNRVKKQQKVEDGLGDITHNVKRLIDDLDKKTADLVGHVTGGDGFCFVLGLGHNMPALVGDNKYALHDLSATLIDLDEMAKNASRPAGDRYTGRRFEIGTLVSGTGVRWQDIVNLDGGKERRYFNINFTARNGQFYQYVRLALVDGEWKRAERVFRANPEVILREFADKEFPRNADGVVDWNYPQ